MKKILKLNINFILFKNCLNNNKKNHVIINLRNFKIFYNNIHKKKIIS